MVLKKKNDDKAIINQHTTINYRTGQKLIKQNCLMK
jgi:hypothetical protein